MLNKIMQRERDRERQRLKRLNPEYRELERERDRNRKRLKRAHEANIFSFILFFLPKSLDFTFDIFFCSFGSAYFLFFFKFKLLLLFFSFLRFFFFFKILT